MQMKRPLIVVLSSYLVGVMLHQIEAFYIIVLGGILTVFIVLWLSIPGFKRKYKLKNFYFLLGLPILFLLGYFLMNKQLSPTSMDAVFEDKIQGVAYGKLKMIEDKGDYTKLTLTNVTLEIKENIEYPAAKIIVYITSSEEYKIGTILSISGTILKFKKASNPGQFNEYQYYKTQKIDYKMNGDFIRIMNEDYSKFYHFLYSLKQRFVGVYQKILPGKEAGILSAMILGEKALLDPEIKELYKQSGISHILAISGLHVSLLGLSVYQILRRSRIPLFPATSVSVFLILSYGILTNFSVSTNRAVVMLVILMAAALVGRTYDLLSATSLSALIILIQAPMELWNVGFLLSFGAILGIALIHPVLMKMYSGKNKLVESLFVSVSIQLATLPVILYFFYDFPPYSVFINLIILPLSSIIILLAVIAVILGSFVLPIGMFFIGGTHYILIFYEAVCQTVARLPGRTFLRGEPDGLVIVAYYCILIFFILINKKQKYKISLILLTFLAIILIKPTPQNLEVTFIDVGQGDGIFMLSPCGTTYLIDGGSTDVRKLGQYRLEPFLKSMGIRVLDYAIITHADTDHISGLIELMEEMEDTWAGQQTTAEIPLRQFGSNIVIRNLVLPSISIKDDAYSKLEALAISKGIEVLYIKKGDFIKEEDLIITCLHPKEDFTFSSRNGYSTVLSVRYKEFDLLLTGDLEEEGENLLIQELLSISQNKTENFEQVAFDYDILKVAHHGSKYSTNREFLELVKPEFSIISCGKENSYGHPHEELIKRLEEIDSEYLITTEGGAVTVITDGKNMMIRQFLE